MRELHKLETLVAGWYQDVPHLPKNGSKWLADNMWWITLVGVIVGVLGVFGLFSALTALTALTGVYGLTPAGYSTGYGSAVMTAWVGIIGLGISVAVMAFAISPLKVHKKKGWDLLFVAEIVYFVIAVVGAVVTLNFFGIVGPIIGTLIGFYFLFEIRSYFASAANHAHKKVVEK